MCARALLNSWRKQLKRQESKDDSNRLSTDRKRRADMGRGDRIGRGVNAMFGKSQDVQNAHMPYRCLEWFWSPFPLNSQCHIAGSLHIPYLHQTLPKHPFFFRSGDCKLWNKQLLKEGCRVFSWLPSHATQSIKSNSQSHSGKQENENYMLNYHH